MVPPRHTCTRPLRGKGPRRPSCVCMLHDVICVSEYVSDARRSPQTLWLGVHFLAQPTKETTAISLHLYSASRLFPKRTWISGGWVKVLMSTSPVTASTVCGASPAGLTSVSVCTSWCITVAGGGTSGGWASGGGVGARSALAREAGVGERGGWDDDGDGDGAVGMTGLGPGAASGAGAGDTGLNGLLGATLITFLTTFLSGLCGGGVAGGPRQRVGVLLALHSEDESPERPLTSSSEKLRSRCNGRRAWVVRLPGRRWLKSGWA